MASRKAKEFLASMGLRCVHTGIELGNFSAGRGNKPMSLPFHVIRMDWDRSGDSKRTVGWAATLADAIRQAHSLNRDGTMAKQCGADTLRQDRRCYYIRDIRNGRIYH